MDANTLLLLIIMIVGFIIISTGGILLLIREKKYRQTWIDNLIEGMIFAFIGVIMIIVLVIAAVNEGSSAVETPISSEAQEYLIIINGIPINGSVPICLGLGLVPLFFISGIVKIVRTLKRRKQGYTNYYKKPRKT
jgi:hypothetical protein